MRRRTLLRAAGATIGAGTLAGCLSENDGSGGPGAGGDAGDPTGTERPPAGTDEPTKRPEDGGDTTTDGDPTEEGTGTSDETAPGDDVAFDPGTDEPFASETIGSREGVENPDDNRPHGVDVWNAADHERELTVAVRRGSATVFERTLAFPADGYLSLTLAEPAAYTVALAADGDRIGEVPVEESWFDCNSSATHIGVFPDGELRSTVVSTMIACDAGDGVADPTIESEEGSCLSGDGAGASVSFGADRLAVDGTIQAPNPCHRAVIADVSERDGEVTLTVGVESTAEGTTACVECVGAVGYRATLSYGASPPESVTVVHRRDDESVIVATDSP